MNKKLQFCPQIVANSKQFFYFFIIADSFCTLYLHVSNNQRMQLTQTRSLSLSLSFSLSLSLSLSFFLSLSLHYKVHIAQTVRTLKPIQTLTPKTPSPHTNIHTQHREKHKCKERHAELYLGFIAVRLNCDSCPQIQVITSYTQIRHTLHRGSHIGKSKQARKQIYTHSQTQTCTILQQKKVFKVFFQTSVLY